MIRCIIMQIIVALFDKKSYPYRGIPLRYWQYYVDFSNRTRYHHWKTLKNYIFDINMLPDWNH